MDIDIITLFPEYFTGPFDVSIIKRAKEAGLLSINYVDIRDFAKNKHRTVDDRPYGGGPGMVLAPQPTVDAIRSKRRENSHVVYLSPQGKVLDSSHCKRLASYEHLILVCGHYEGIDERIIELEVDEEISVGDFVLTNGGAAAIILVDATARFIPEVLGHPDAAAEDSFEKGYFDCPHYTRPESFEGLEVPDVLLSGHHANIEKWRKEQAMKKTLRVRPELVN